MEPEARLVSKQANRLRVAKGGLADIAAAQDAVMAIDHTHPRQAQASHDDGAQGPAGPKHQVVETPPHGTPPRAQRRTAK
eukprot:12062634-Heterocapsa_arctica.AAC.1